jgi:RNA polymerase sigma factor (sigma-70 family)
MSEPDDITLLKQYAEGDESAFTALFERHVHLVYSAALRQARNPSQAEEVTQAVFILLARKAKSLSPKTILSGWLYQAARLTTASLIKREIRRQRREQEMYMQTLTEPDVSLWEQVSPLLDEAMGRLGEKDRNAIVLRFFENRTPQEVAVALKLNEVTARKHVSRALEKLRTLFAKRGVVLTTAIIAGTISGNSVQAAPAALASSVTAVAIAKGVAVSGSTLTLVKGALKLMAWSQAKTAVVATIAVILTAGTTTLVIKEILAPRVMVYRPIPDHEPDITARVRNLKMEDLRAEDCTPEFWQQLQQLRQSAPPGIVESMSAAMGPLRSVTLVERTEDHGRPSYLYRMEYQNMNALFWIIFDGDKIAYAGGHKESK